MVISVLLTAQQEVTYNFTVDDFHTYYVTEYGVLVHNANKPCKKDSSKAEKHGDDGRALTKAEIQIQGYMKKLETATGNERKRLLQKIKNVLKDAEKKRSGVNDNNRGVRN